MDEVVKFTHRKQTRRKLKEEKIIQKQTGGLSRLGRIGPNRDLGRIGTNGLSQGGSQEEQFQMQMQQLQMQQLQMQQMMPPVQTGVGMSPQAVGMSPQAAQDIVNSQNSLLEKKPKDAQTGGGGDT